MFFQHASHDHWIATINSSHNQAQHSAANHATFAILRLQGSMEQAQICQEFICRMSNVVQCQWWDKMEVKPQSKPGTTAIGLCVVLKT